MKQILLLLMAYVLGSIPFGYLVGIYLKKIDIRKFGSGNIGTTNAFRILGTKPAILVLVLDLVKGFIPAYLAASFGGPTLGLLAGLLSMAGHNWSIFLGFKGGRGVATGAGVLLALTPKVFILTAILFFLVSFATRYVSLGSILGAILVPILMVVFNEPTPYMVFGFVASLFVLIRHIPNIKRLINGTELKVEKLN